MLVMTAKLTGKKIITGILAIGVVICAVALIRGNLVYGGVADMVNAPIKIENIKTPEDRVALLKGFGWQVEEEPLEFTEVQIPEEFDEVYTKYNEIQLAQGMDLKKYAGKRAMRYTFEVTNYPTGEAGIIANILVYKNKLIGGDVCSPQLNGFMHGLSMPE